MRWEAWLAGGYTPTAWVLTAAQLLAVYGVLLTVALALWLWWRQPADRANVAGSVLVCLLAVFVSHRMAMAIGHPRPFMLGLSPAYIAHAARGSLPSTHASALFAIALCWLWMPGLRWAGALAAVAATAVGWARVYCGVHFPLDIAVGAALGGVLASLYAFAWTRYIAVLVHGGGKSLRAGVVPGPASTPAKA